MARTRQLEESISSVIREMERELEAVGNRVNELVDQALDEGGPAIQAPLYGLSVEIGADGLPHLQRFGNIAGAKMGLSEGTFRPFISWRLDQTHNQAVITADLPDFEKGDIELELINDTIKVHAENDENRFHAEASLPFRLKADEPKATFDNGELEVRIDLEPRQETRGRTIDIE